MEENMEAWNFAFKATHIAEFSVGVLCIYDF